ncbi:MULTISPECIES: hypothetical protein [Mycobacterium]|jgi:hypothetical protein|uniref:Uncharacterized protein n=1 Tax=Mycobacterium parascrofulaceum ATCC BAA-614 TaxID=525368 RepID=D5P6K6_9MYCO|nr:MULTISPECIES: hypothetical protein [Mycobacterium]EFG78276.1 hypothetical protein HMPREF0591_1800 [Mycobacterium parascrofulaceum ATCC BAA-614]
MAIDTLTDTVLDEAERIVRAEWMRLQLDTALSEPQVAEAPAARPRPTQVAAVTTTLDRPSRPPSDSSQGSTRRRQNRVWPTQRSPPTRTTSP